METVSSTGKETHYHEKFFKKFLSVSPPSRLLSAGATIATAENLEGRWSATLVQGGVTIPFRLDYFEAMETKPSVRSTTAKTRRLHRQRQHQGPGKVELNFDHYLTSIVATVKDGQLDGTTWVT